MGAEIAKVRPAVVVNLTAVGKLPLRIVVPVTEWKPAYALAPWLVYLKPTKGNGLSKESAADAFQVKSVSLERFISRAGVVTANELEQISAAIALCVGAT
jgi:mRNA interferase MazF